MTTDAPPNDVLMARTPLGPIAKRRSAIARPGHFPHAIGALDSLNAQPLTEAATLQVFNELTNREIKGFSLCRLKPVQIEPESFLPLERRHTYEVSRSSAARNSSAESK